MTLLAHGVGSRTDLPIPLGLALYGGGAAVLISFAALLLFWRKPTLGDSSSGRPLPAAVQRAAEGLGPHDTLLVVAHDAVNRVLSERHGETRQAQDKDKEKEKPEGRTRPPATSRRGRSTSPSGWVLCP